MDPFEGRLQFLDLLKRLQASQASQARTAQFALRHQDLDEDLFSCVLEELTATSFNARVNILYFLETLCDACKKAGVQTYVSMVRRDLRQIIELVAPLGSQGAANVAQARHFLRTMLEKDFLEVSECRDLDAGLAGRDTARHATHIDDATTHGSDAVPVITKEDIFRRIEEDRERHKKLRESLWVVPAPNSHTTTTTTTGNTTQFNNNNDTSNDTSNNNGPDYDSQSLRGGGAVGGPGDWEFRRAWEDTSDLCEDDFVVIKEETALCIQSRAGAVY